MPATTRRSRLRIGNVPIDPLTFSEALDEIGALVEAGEGGYVFTPNVDHVVNADQHEGFREAYAKASLSLVDGQPLVWASRILGAPLPEKVSGSDLVEPLMERAGSRGWKVFLLGAAPGVAEKAARIFEQRYRVRIAGFESPMLKVAPSPDDGPLAARISASGAKLVLVALGSPKQELWIHRMASTLRPAVALGIGATLDFITGSVRRSPKWMSRAGLEWVYRLSQEPGRLWRRYLVQDPKFALIFLRALRARKDGPAEDPSL